MIKIKDNVDLKELEKFGFKDNKYIRCGEYNNPLYVIYVTRNHRYIQIRTYGYGELTIAGKLQDKLYDLIQAGLVEKVGDIE